jgi:hypothetical protein
MAQFSSARPNYHYLQTDTMKELRRPGGIGIAQLQCFEVRGASHGPKRQSSGPLAVGLPENNPLAHLRCRNDERAEFGEKGWWSAR